jgi:O-antigen ligase
MFATRPRFLALAAFLFAGDMKADPRFQVLPVDLTLLTGAILTLVILRRLPRWRLRSFLAPGLMAIWFLTFLFGVVQAVETEYGSQKMASLYTFTLLAGLAPLFLVESSEDFGRMLNAIALFCLVIVLGAASGLAGGQHLMRLEAFGAGTISLGRASGLLFAYAALQILRGCPLPALPFALLAGAGVIALFSGSRGPIVAAVASLGGLLVLGRQALGKPALRLALAAVLFLGVLGFSASLAPEGSLRRVENFAQGNYGTSERYRLTSLQISLDYLREDPDGLGWGAFATHVNPLNGMGRQYPHNLLAEVTLESGWICGAWTLLMLVAASAAAWSRTASHGGRVVFTGLLFYLINAMVSGDVNDNRPLFLFVSSALMLLDYPGVAHG